MPNMICVSIGRTRHKMMIAEHKKLSDEGAQLVELRVDWLQSAPDLGRLLKDRPTATVFTCRRSEDKGLWKGSEEQRMMLLRQAIVSGVEYIDLESDIAKRVPRYGKTKRIISYHNFEDTPENLGEIYGNMRELDPDIIKISTMANSPMDGVRMLQLVQEARVPTVGFCMGELGIFSRILCGKFGSPFTYATFNKDRVLAPGQLSFDEMRNIYHFDEINRKTRMFGVVGDPIGHSLSPLIHNTAFRHEKLNCVYLPLRVPQDSFAESMKGLDALGFEGFSVTIPHKETVAKAGNLSDDIVKDTGAANTLYRDPMKHWFATNTDYDAAMEALQSGLPEGETLMGKKVLMLGAGGVARAIGLGVTRAGAGLTICNRTKDRGKELAEKLNCQHVTWENRGSVFADVLINCTPIGMHPELDKSPYQQNWLREGMVVFDTIYNPENSLLLKEARARECRTISGMEMFVRQAATQFECFTGQPAPRELMAKTVRRAISPVNIRLSEETEAN